MYGANNASGHCGNGKGESVTIEPTSQLKRLLELTTTCPKSGRMQVTEEEYVLFDAGILIAALIIGDCLKEFTKPDYTSSHTSPMGISAAGYFKRQAAGQQCAACERR